MTETRSHIVVGLGGIGSAAAFHLAARGERVLGLDANQPGHQLGSSHGRTRVVRQAYFEGLEYVPLAVRAWELWGRLEEQSGRVLLNRCGVLLAGPRDADAGLLDTGAAAAASFGLAHEDLGGEEINARFPAFRVPAEWRGILEHAAGFVDPELAVRTHLELAAAHGAELHHGERVSGFAADGEGVAVETDRGRYRADRLLLTVGPWAPETLGTLGLPIRATRKVVAHFQPRRPERFVPAAFPAYFLALPDREVYGLPYLPGQGVKIARHDGGETCTPETVRREVDEAEPAELRATLEAYLPDGAGELLDSYTCLYTMSVDENFIVDEHPGVPGCWYATGCSGHAFKFTPALGAALADRATGEIGDVDIGFLSARRFA